MPVFSKILRLVYLLLNKVTLSSAHVQTQHVLSVIKNPCNNCTICFRNNQYSINIAIKLSVSKAFIKVFFITDTRDFLLSIPFLGLPARH